MNTAYFEYKCRRCGSMDRNPSTGESMAHLYLIAAAQHYDLRHALQPQLVSIHACEDGGYGISDLIGYSVDKL